MGHQQNFTAALEVAIDMGAEIAREGWNGKGMSVFRASGGTFKIGGQVMGDLQPFLVMKTVDGTFVPWLASQSDLLADDWVVLP